MDLIAYFSISGNTKKVAEKLNSLVDADIFEIKAKKEYPTEYRSLVDVSKVEWEENQRPELAEDINIEEYDKIFLLYPNWFGTVPMVVATFLENHDFAEKTLQPICTNGGGGLGNSVSFIEELTDGEVFEGLDITSSQVDTCEEKLSKII